MSDYRPLNAKLLLASFVVVLALAYAAYRPALTGVFELDDVSNLSELAYVEDAGSLLDFMLSGKAGPTGRPVALLSFGLQAEHWEQGAAAFLHVNVIIHLVNAIILAWCLYQLGLLQSVNREKAGVVAAAAASVWVMMPLLATASLLVVQRMTTLSALFMLLGLGAYLATRRRIAHSPRNSLTAMTAILVVATGLAALAKESGLLLPVYVLVLESTLLVRPTAIGERRWRAWKIVVLALPAAVLFAYLVSKSVYPEWMEARRDFNGWQRLLTETQILWLYLKKAIVGLPGQLGIFQANLPVARSLLDPMVIMALLAWTALAAGALIWRRRQPIAAFAVLWFLAGHSLESTVLPLELYFEHRNYLPIIGPVFALCSFLLATVRRNETAVVAAISGFVLLNAYFLYVFASLWGDPSGASRYWAVRHPDSVRAATNLATYQLLEEGPERGAETLRRFTAEHREHAYLRTQELNIRCIYGLDSDVAAIVSDLERDLPTVDFTYTAGTMLSQLFTTSTQGRCDIDSGTVKQLAIALQRNPRYVNDPYYTQFHHKLLAGIARFEGDHAAAMDHLRTAISFWPTMELNMMMVTGLAGEGDFDAADEFIDNAMLDAPSNPLKAMAWRRGLESLRDYVRELEKHTTRNQADQPSVSKERDE